MASRVPAFSFAREPIDPAPLRAALADPACGGFAAFEGWVRNHNEGRRVRRLEYEAFEPLAVREGERIVAEAVARFGIEHAACVHRIGDLAIGEMAVWVGVSARHRDEAFRACRYIIDEVKHRVPIWKKEHYEDGDSGWVNCERCAAAPREAGAQAHAHARRHAHAPVPDYSRQMALREVGPSGQARLRAARVLVVGCGGLGVPVMTYLAGAGVGRLTLVDGDRLEPSNLHRQTLYALADCGRPKAELAAERLRALNPDVEVRGHVLRLDAANGAPLVAQHDLVVDCTDNFATKFLLNDLCVQLGRPVILSSVYQYEGQLQVVRPERGGACLRCLWPHATRDGLVGNCAEAGVLGPVPGVFGTLQALEALKVLLDLPGQHGDELLVIDLLTLSLSRVRTRRAAECRGGSCVRTAAALRADEEPDDLELSFASLDEAAHQGYTIVDIREAHEVRETPTPAESPRHVPLGALLKDPAAISGAGKTLLVCATGRRSRAAALELRSRGVAGVHSLRGGIAALGQGSPA